MFLDVANLVAVAELPVTLAAIGLVTVKLVSVPTEVKEDPTIVEFKEVPVNVVAAAGTEYLHCRQKLLQLYFLWLPI